MTAREVLVCRDLISKITACDLEEEAGTARLETNVEPRRDWVRTLKERRKLTAAVKVAVQRATWSRKTVRRWKGPKVGTEKRSGSR